jgi:hypothetical protein
MKHRIAEALIFGESNLPHRVICLTAMDLVRGFAAAHSGKPPAFRPASFLFTEAVPRSLYKRRRSLLNFWERLDGKLEAYRYVLRQSR